VGLGVWLGSKEEIYINLKVVDLNKCRISKYGGKI
jgi:hypothetical protein